MFVAQNLRQHARAHLTELAEGGGAGIEVEGVHDVLGRFRVRILNKQPLQNIAAAGNHVHAFHQRLVEVAQHLLHHVLGHRRQLHNRAGNIGYFLSIHALEHVRGELVTHGKQKYGNALLSRQFHPRSSTATSGCLTPAASPRSARPLPFFLI